ncbi:MerR family transcriptional regulator [Effusibacillus dendaii]|uniref:HTH-type transcriptional regulator GlnR n=1 Tax=Effusibacillus dendaii TaxID=2743772 RepID=A0A7I8D543_9BACL|nr:MerR family transcriptional regulator [Effusibacillus dendaii]BCJ85195.1 HTH-type transcriptional regulator GlnR [Effusibacillus dendaii]
MVDPVPRDMAVLTIGIVKQLTGFSLRQIRYYEDLDLIAPYRTQGDQRLYSINDVARLLHIKDLVDQEYPMWQIKQVLKPPSMPEEPKIRPTPSEQELDDGQLLRDIRGSLQTRRNPTSPSMIEGQLSQFFRQKRR